MSIDSSLKIRGALSRHRNVLTRDERIAQLKEEELWKEGDPLMGLPKVAHRKVSVGKKDAKEKTDEDVEATAGEAVTEAAPSQ